MLHCFKLQSSLSPEHCRTVLKAAVSGKEEPYGFLCGSFFRILQKECFRSAPTLAIRYTVYGKIRGDGNGGSTISCVRFQSTTDPLWWFPMFFILLLAFTFFAAPPRHGNITMNLGGVLLITLIVVGTDCLRCFLGRKQTGETVESGLDSFLCDRLQARIMTK